MQSQNTEVFAGNAMTSLVNKSAHLHSVNKHPVSFSKPSTYVCLVPYASTTINFLGCEDINILVFMSLAET